MGRCAQFPQRLRNATVAARSGGDRCAQVLARRPARQDRPRFDAARRRSLGIPPDAARRLRARHPSPARQAGSLLARRAVLPDRQRQHRTAAAAEPPRCRGARRAGASDRRRSLHHGRRLALHRARRVSERRSASLQPVLLRPRQPDPQVFRLSARFSAGQPSHAQQAFHRRQRDGGRRRTQHRRRILHAQRLGELRRHGCVHHWSGRDAARGHLRCVLEQSLCVPRAVDHQHRARRASNSTRWSTKASR